MVEEGGRSAKALETPESLVTGVLSRIIAELNDTVSVQGVVAIINE